MQDQNIVISVGGSRNEREVLRLIASSGRRRKANTIIRRHYALNSSVLKQLEALKFEAWSWSLKGLQPAEF